MIHRRATEESGLRENCTSRLSERTEAGLQAPPPPTLHSAVGKAYYRGKDSTEARSPERKLIPDMLDRNYEPTSLRAIANRVLPCAEASATEEPDAGKLHVRVCTGDVG